MPTPPRPVPLFFWRSTAGREPVREWLSALPPEDRRRAGVDIAKVQYGWPIGMPVCRPLGDGLWEVRSSLPSAREARVIFALYEGRIVALHGFIKKSAKTSPQDLALARERHRELKT